MKIRSEDFDIVTMAVDMFLETQPPIFSGLDKHLVFSREEVYGFEILAIIDSNSFSSTITLKPEHINLLKKAINNVEEMARDVIRGELVNDVTDLDVTMLITLKDTIEFRSNYLE